MIVHHIAVNDEIRKLDSVQVTDGASTVALCKHVDCPYSLYGIT